MTFFFFSGNFLLLVASSSAFRTFGGLPKTLSHIHVIESVKDYQRKFSLRSVDELTSSTREYELDCACEVHCVGGTRRAFLAPIAASSLGIFGRNPVLAFCGQKYPDWAYFLKFEEGLVPFGSSSPNQIFIRVVGTEAAEAKAKVLPLLVISGGPGLSHEYLETIDAVAKSDRRVASFDPLGTGQSKGSSLDVVATPSSLAAQAATVASAAGFRKHHVFAHGTGAAAAVLYCANANNSVASLTLASPIFGAPVYSLKELAQMPLGGTTPSPPICLSQALPQSPGYSWVPATASELTEAAMATPPTPTYLTYGKDDLKEPVLDSLESTKRVMALMAAGAGSNAPDRSEENERTKRFESSGHFAHLSERDAYLFALFEFLSAVDGGAIP